MKWDFGLKLPLYKPFIFRLPLPQLLWTSMMTDKERRCAGNFRASQTNLQELTFADLENPWNFFRLFMSTETEVNDWCRRNGLLVSQLPCSSKKQNGRRSSEGEKCDGIMVLKESACRTGRDTTLQEEPEPSKGHEGELFLWGLYTDHSRLHALHQMLPGQAVSSSVLQIVGIAYGLTAVNWGSFVRKVFKEHFHRNTRMKKLSGIVELDESLFGKRTKYHRGSPHGGMKVQNL